MQKGCVFRSCENPIETGSWDVTRHSRTGRDPPEGVAEEKSNPPDVILVSKGVLAVKVIKPAGKHTVWF